MSLTLVPRFKTGDAPVAAGAISRAAEQALEHCCTESGVPTSAEREMATGVLSSTLALCQWIACDCLGRDLARAPVMYPQHTRAGALMLVRNYARPTHAEHCPFARLRRPSAAQPEPAGAAGTSPFEILRVASPVQRPRKATESSDPRASSDHTPVLARILFRLLGEAGATHIDPEGLSRDQIHAVYASLHAAVAANTLDRGGCIPLDKVCVVGLDHAQELVAMLSSKRIVWPHPLVPQGFLITYAKGVDPATGVLTGSHGDLKLGGHLRRFGAGTEPPYIAIVLFGQEKAGEGPIKPLRGYAHPLFAAWSLLPVDSGKERDTLQVLLGTQHWLLTKKATPVSIDKPMRDMQTSAGVPVRPDFIIERRDGARLCIETMGYETGTYLNRKLEMHGYMREIGEVVQHRPGDAEQDQNLRRAVARFALTRSVGTQEANVSR